MTSLGVSGGVKQPGVNAASHGLRDAVRAIGFLPAQLQLQDALLIHYQFPYRLAPVLPLGRKLAHTVVWFEGAIVHQLLPSGCCIVNKPVSCTSFHAECTTLTTFAKVAMIPATLTGKGLRYAKPCDWRMMPLCGPSPHSTGQDHWTTSAGHLGPDTGPGIPSLVAYSIYSQEHPRRLPR